MSDPMIGLLSLQEELSKNRITLRNCTNSKLCMFLINLKAYLGLLM